MRDALKATRVRAVLVAGALAIAAGLALHLTGLLSGLERSTIDTRFAVRGAEPTDEVAVVAVDEDTFGELRNPRWPFKRTLHAELVDRLREAGAREIVYDVQFTEPSDDPDADLALYDAIGRAGGATLATAEADGQGHTKVLGGDEMLRDIGSRAGAANSVTDPGGVVRRYPAANGRLASLPMVVAQRLRAPVDREDFANGIAWIDYRGGPGTFETFSFSDVHAGRVSPAALRGKIVVVGATAATLQDRHPSSTSSDMSGPEIQANAIWTALHGNPLRSVPGWTTLLLIVLLGAAAPLLVLRLRLLALLVTVPLIGAAYLAAAQALFAGGRIVAVAAPMAALVLGAAGAFTAALVVEVAERRRVKRYSERLEVEVRARTRELRETQLEIVHRLAQAAESRDDDTGAHIERMSRLCERLGRAAGMSEAEAETLRHASVLHDVGKIGIPDSVLLKPGKLDDLERSVMQTHTKIGADVLKGSRSPVLQLAEEIARTHHERWDGTGYPDRLGGEAIPVAGRIAAICDVFDALTGERPYKEAWPAERALDEIERERGRHFDPELVDAFIAMMRSGDHQDPPQPPEVSERRAAAPVGSPA